MTNILLLIARRIGIALFILLLVSMVVFSLSSLLPGDAAQQLLGQSATPEALAALPSSYRLRRGASPTIAR